ncbi:UNVERIFIED_CONTAM: hypothetical protein Cloal_2134 [Acetivibrio alkalicellulosi]
MSFASFTKKHHRKIIIFFVLIISSLALLYSIFFHGIKRPPDADRVQARLIKFALERYINDTNDICLIKLTTNNKLNFDSIVENLKGLDDPNIKHETYLTTKDNNGKTFKVEDFYPNNPKMKGWKITIYMKSKTVSVEAIEEGNIIKFIEYE